MQGKEIDLEKLMRQNELMPAIGNMKVNARGDELGPGGQIVKRREDLVAAYYDSNPNVVSKKARVEEEKPAPKEVVEEKVAPKSVITKPKKLDLDEEE
jgi:hypothetical protein